MLNTAPDETVPGETSPGETVPGEGRIIPQVNDATVTCA